MMIFTGSEPQSFLDWAILISYAFLLIAFILGGVRLVRGPTVPDRIMALDFITLVAIGFVALTALETGREAYLDVAIALALVAFLATVAFARYVARRSRDARDARD